MAGTNSPRAEVVVLQPVAVVDHLLPVSEQQLAVYSGPARNGSARCTREAFQSIIAEIGEYTCRAGGSGSNTAKALATGFGVQVEIVSFWEFHRTIYFTPSAAITTSKLSPSRGACLFQLQSLDII